MKLWIKITVLCLISFQQSFSDTNSELMRELIGELINKLGKEHHLPAVININNNQTHLNLDGVGLTKQLDLAKQKTWGLLNDLLYTLKNNKIKVAGLSLAALYLKLFYQINCAKKILYSPNSWCNWPKNSTFSDLITEPSNLLYSKLITAALEKYSHQDQNSANLGLFTLYQDLNHELLSIKNLETISYRLGQLRLQKFFLINHDLLLALVNKKNQLIYLKKLLLEAKISHNVI